MDSFVHPKNFSLVDVLFCMGYLWYIILLRIIGTLSYEFSLVNSVAFYLLYISCILSLVSAIFCSSKFLFGIHHLL